MKWVKKIKQKKNVKCCGKYFIHNNIIGSTSSSSSSQRCISITRLIQLIFIKIEIKQKKKVNIVLFVLDGILLSVVQSVALIFSYLNKNLYTQRCNRKWLKYYFNLWCVYSECNWNGFANYIKYHRAYVYACTRIGKQTSNSRMSLITNRCVMLFGRSVFQCMRLYVYE